MSLVVAAGGGGAGGLGGIEGDDHALEKPKTAAIQVTLYRRSKNGQRQIKYKGEARPLSTNEQIVRCIPDGFGTGFYRDRSTYEGSWKQGKRDGYGEFSAPVEGVCQGDNAPLYAGQWREDQRYGFGIQFYSAKSIYEGLWRNNLREGWGRMLYDDGSVYEGTWLSDRRHGIGLFKTHCGDCFEGMWRYDLKHGTGSYHFNKTNRALQGEWHNDVFISGDLLDPPAGEDSDR